MEFCNILLYNSLGLCAKDIKCIINTFIIPIDAHYYTNHRMLKYLKNYNTCSDMFRFTHEPSSGSSPVLR